MNAAPAVDLSAEVKSFLDAEVFQLTLCAVTQRGKMYEGGLTDEQREPARDTLRNALEAMWPKYRVGVSDEAHLENIRAITEKMRDRHARILRGGIFRVGLAQKALNLYLKYRWCLGEIVQPPHCPFDGMVLTEIPKWRSRSWIAIDRMEDYVSLVQAARAVAGKQGLAMWELSVYNRIAGQKYKKEARK